MKLRRTDVEGRTLRVGQVVRIVGVPDFTQLPRGASRRELEAVFGHVLGTYKKICGFNQYGLAEIEFRIRTGPHAGQHTIWSEPEFLRIHQPRSSHPSS